LIAFAHPALAQEGDRALGETVFRKCLACHRIDTPDNLTGPNLQHIIGRPAGAVKEYKYSPAMQAKAAEGWIWTEDNLKAYLAEPQHVVPGTKMAFPGLKKPEELSNLIAFLKTK
jgi:cytochrome c